MSFRKNIFTVILVVLLTAACAPATPAPIHPPTYDPFLPIPPNTTEASPVSAATMTATREPTPTRAPITISLPPTADFNNTPTPNAERVLPTPRQDSAQYVIQAGDSLGLIAQNYGISVEALMATNNIADANLLEVGMNLNIPAPSLADAGSGFKVIPDSEMVYGPAGVYFDIQKFIESQNGYLETYEQDVNGVTLTGYEIVWIVARNYSVNPRLLLALLEYQSGWVTNPAPLNTAYPMGLLDENRYGLYRQLA
ncbi:MAG: LysM peptidoglycan-binding domain-containing protein, partial [Anaerolineales bacterium]|nr:LysM peptidoglycan-binding domain-containing protein [Anaerolineales bacterium]